MQDPMTAQPGEGRPYATQYDKRGAYWTDRAHHERLTDPGLASKPGDWYNPSNPSTPNPPQVKRAKMRPPPWAQDTPQEDLVYSRSALNSASNGAPANETRYTARSAWE